MTERGERPYQIAVFGATGYTGKFVVEELKKRQTKGVAWAVAGRNKDKLKAVLRGRRPLTVEFFDLSMICQLTARAMCVLFFLSLCHSRARLS